MLPLRDVVEDKDNFYKLVCIVVSCIAALYIAFGEFTNLAYGEKME